MDNDNCRMRDDQYLTISTTSSGIFKDRKSKFIGLAFPVKTEEDIKSILKANKKEYFDATHHCYAYMLGHQRTNYRANDDGEPSSSAGMPILGQINSKNLTNILIIVVRYYGGIKLGVSGLINAYRQAAIEAISTNEIITETVRDIFEISFTYPEMNNIMHILKETNATQISSNYDLNCNVKIAIDQSLTDTLIERLNNIENIEFKLTETI